MILVGNRRGCASELAAHLFNAEDNEHVELHEVRGFVASNLEGALHEAYGISRGTRCKKFLYSLSLSPPQDENVPVKVFEAAIERIEHKLGFGGQPRAIVFHEKKGRRHAHVVWSRIHADTMTAIDPYKDQEALQQIARELYLEHEWELPDGFIRKEDTDPLNYSHAEHAQAKRAKRDVKELKRIFRQCWERTDTRDTFAHAMKEQGFLLAKGDKRGFVAVDAQGEVYSVARYAGVKAKELRARIGSFDSLPDVESAKSLSSSIEKKSSEMPKIDNDVNITTNVNTATNLATYAHPPSKNSYWDTQKAELQEKLEALGVERVAMVVHHRNVRALLHQKQQKRHIAEIKTRSAKLPRGLKAVWFKLSGQYDALITANKQEIATSEARDRSEQQSLIEIQLSERRVLQKQIQISETKLLGSELRFLSIEPEQALVIPPDPDVLTIKEKVNQCPEHILQVMTQTEESFTRNNILRSLAKYIENPLKLGAAIEQVMRSAELTVLDEDHGHKDININQKNNDQYRNTKTNKRYTTRSFLDLKHELEENVLHLSSSSSTYVSNANINAAIKQQNKILNKQFGATLSEQQKAAIRHGLDKKQFTAIVGLAGTGKSTILSAVKIALERQGYTVHGAALSGKAADGLEQASQIKSRTLASWTRSWDQGNGYLTSNDVLIIDEAGMIGTKQLLRFVKEAKRSGAKLLLVGDPEQLQPINAGTPFTDICKIINPARLTEIHRQIDDWQKQASLDLAEQRIDEALKAYEVHDNITQTKNTSEAILKLVDDYMADLELNGNATSRIALAHRRKDVHAINQAIRMQRKTAGDLFEADEAIIQTDHGKRAFAKGDRIVFTKNDRSLGVRNGMLGTVKSVTEIDCKIELSIRIDGEPPKTITIDPEHYASFDHGYATTIHKSQGVTVDRAFVLASTTMDRHLTYVSMTRHKEDCRLYGEERTLRRIKSAKNKLSGKRAERAIQQIQKNKNIPRIQ